MKKNKWLRLKSVDDPMNLNLEKGELFLHGNRMINQKEVKKIGEEITYFKVLESDGNRMEYIQIFDKLEEDVDERN